MITKGEKKFFETIRDSCKTIFDIGCREDIYYLENATEKIFYLFEPNPASCLNCRDKIKNAVSDKTIQKNEIFLYNLGIGKETCNMPYYSDTETLYKRHIHAPSFVEPVYLPVQTLSYFLEQNNVESIDFLKMDVEGFEVDILLDNIDFINNKVKYVQFEWSSGWFERDNKKTFADVFNPYTKNFAFFFMYDKDHPYAESCPNYITSIISQEDYVEVNKAIEQGYGINIAMIQRRSK